MFVTHCFLYICNRQTGSYGIVNYFDYVRRIKDNPIAKKVKLADLAHNMDRTRIVDCSVVSTEKLDKWDEKYSKAMKILID
mgnify:CR=1 FL=1